ncbi:MAG: hypothetical protein Q9157_001082 [Trypethelium eluteriae]
MEQLVDDVTFTRRGVSVVNRAGNQLEGGLKWMLEQMLRSPTGQDMRSQGGQWKRRDVRRYLRQVEQWLEQLLASVHITSGQPARGTEITTMRHRNSFLQDRNIFVVDGQVMTVIRYHKSQSQWDKPKIVPRFLPVQLGHTMVIYLAYVQRWVEYLRVQVLGETGRDYDYIWADERGPWDTGRMTRIIKHETAKRLGATLTTLDYRHVAVGIGRRMVGEQFSRGYQDDVGEGEEAEVEKEEGESVLELQSTRTTQIGINNYSVPVDIVKHLSERSIEVFRPLSEQWHQFLGLTMDRDRQQKPRREIQDQMTGPGIKQTRITVKKNSGMKIEREEQMEVGADAEQRAEGIDRGRIGNQRPYDTTEPPIDSDRYNKRVKRIEHTDMAIQQALQQVLGGPDAQFKSVEQGQAIRAVVAGVTPLVVVLPTGGGKSLLFMVPARLADAGVTVVVVPFRALIGDLLQRLAGAGIEAIEWQYGQTDPAAVVVVSADIAGDDGFLGYARVLQHKQLLRRVVIDECHLIFTASKWRWKLAELKQLRVLGCPLVLLTAILPPGLEEELGDSMHIRCAQYIRASTV